MISSQRRTVIAAATLVLASGLLSGCTGSGDTDSARPASSTASTPTDPAASRERAAKALAQVERRFHARLGVYMLDTGTGRTVTYRAGERFAHASTFKALASGIVLKRSTDDELNRRHPTTAPRTSRSTHRSPSGTWAAGMTLRDLVKAALQYSDNTAANLLLDQLGGPAGLQRALRARGDTTTRVDRTEPALNEAKPGDTRDTSTPRALGTDLRGFVLGDALPEGRRQLLTSLAPAGTRPGAPTSGQESPPDGRSATRRATAGTAHAMTSSIVWPNKRGADRRRRPVRPRRQGRGLR